MKNTLAFKLAVSLFLIPLLGSAQNPINITKTTVDGGNKTYVAQDNILFVPGYEYDQSQQYRLHAYIDVETGYQSLLTGADFAQSNINTSNLVGTTPGEYNVSASGGAGYNVPIQLPAGSNQMSMSLGLSYNSHQGNGNLGMGWNLQGVSSITLIPSTLYHDDEVENIEMDGEDRFALDGKKLFVSSGTYGANNAEYKTEIETYTKVTSYGGGTTPDWFKVETKDGLTMEYGKTSDSKITGHNGNGVEWYISRIYDTYGNYAVFEYWNENGEHRLDRIRYTGNESRGILPYNIVKFRYSMRSDKNSYFKYGKEIRQNHLLEKIEIHTEGEHFKSYQFEYGLNLHSFLKSITEIGANGEQLNSTLIKYGDPTEDIEVVDVPMFAGMGYTDFEASRDYNGDGKSDLLLTEFHYDGGIKIYDKWKVYVSNTYNTFSYYAQGAIPNGYIMFFDHRKDDVKLSGLATGLDFWGDGADDVILVKYNATGSGVTLSSIQLVDINGYNNTDVSYPSVPVGGYIDMSKSLQLGDFNGDGRDDIFIMRYASSTNPIYSGKIITVQGGVHNVVMSGLAYLNASHQVLPSDFDGDGKKELMVLYDNSCEIFEFESEPQAGNYHVHKIYHSGNPGFPTRWHTIIPGDFNGDGKTDILTSGDNVNWYVAYSNGVNFVAKGFTFQTNYNTSSSSHGLKIGDFNGDGKTDILHAHSIFNGNVATTSRLNVYYSNGMSFEYETEVVDLITSYDDFSVGDVNGDGKQDVFNRDFYQDPAMIFYFKRNSREHYVHKIKDGFNRTVTFNYSWLTQTNAYANGAPAAFPVIDRRAAIPVVTSMQAPNGANGTTTVGYSYAGAKWHQQGLGFLGFSKVVSQNYSTGIRSTSQYDLYTDVMVPKLRLMLHTSDREELISTNQAISEVTYGYNVTSLSGIRVKVQRSSSVATDYLKDRSNTTNLSYDAFGNVTTLSASNGVETSVTQNQYGTFGSWWIPSVLTTTTTTVTRSGQVPYARTSNYIYSSKGSMIKEVVDPGMPKSVTKQLLYDGFGNVIRTTVLASGETSVINKTEFDHRGRFVTATINPLGQRTEITSDRRWGKPLLVEGPDGNSESFVYNGFGELRSSTNARGITTDYAKVWDVTVNNSTTQPLNTLYYREITADMTPTKKVWHDELNREVMEFTEGLSGGLFVVRKYDARGNVMSSTNPFFYASTPVVKTYMYDNFNRPSSMNDGVSTITYSYSASAGQYSETTNAPTGTIVNVTDASGKIVSTTDEAGTLNYTYYSNGQEKEILFGGTVMVTMNYDDYGRQTELVDVDAGTMTYDYDAFGRLIEQTDANGNNYVLEYDVLGREISKVGAEGTYTKTYITGGNGLNRLMASTTPGGNSTEYEYDTYGRSILEREEVDGEIFETEFTYDAKDNMTSIKYPSGYTVNMQYNSDGYLSQVVDQYGNAHFKNLQANEYGKYTSYELGNGVVTEYEYDAHGLLETISAVGVQDLEYNFHSQTGNLIWRKDHIKGKQDIFSYDASNRLIEYKTALIANPLLLTIPVEISYAANGNILEKTDVGEYSYDPNKIHAVVGIDNGGGVIPATTQNVAYTSFDRVGSIDEGDFDLEFEYNAEWMRVKSELYDNGVLTKTKFYIGSYEKEVTNTGTREVHHIPTGGGSYATYVIDDGVGKYYYEYKDYLGSVLAVTDEYGVVQYEQNFDAWGRERNATSWNYNPAAVPDDFTWVKGYTGHEYLREFSLIHMENRLYDPLIARMLSPDNFVQGNYLTQNYNRYSYVFNNPLKYSDPTGEFAVVDSWLIGFVDGFFRQGSNRWSNAWQGANQKAGNDLRIWGGLFVTDPNKKFFGRVWELVSRFTWQLPQTAVGFTYGHFRNTIMLDVTQVGYWGGATAITSGQAGGVSLGSYIVGRESLRADPHNSLFQHEYGHYLQSQAMGFAYFVRVGIPSILSTGDHNLHPVEQDANRRGFLYMNERVPGFQDDTDYSDGKGWDFFYNSFADGVGTDVVMANPYNGLTMTKSYVDYQNSAHVNSLDKLKVKAKWYDYTSWFTFPGVLGMGLINAYNYNN